MALTSVHTKRLVQYHAFVERMNMKVGAWEEQGNTELRPFMDRMKSDVEKLNEVYRQQMGGRTGPEHLRYQTEAIETLKTLVEEGGLEVYPEAAFLLEENHQFIALFEKVTLRVGAQAREWARQVAHSCAHYAAAVEYAEEIRREIRELLGSETLYETVY